MIGNGIGKRRGIVKIIDGDGEVFGSC
ncbi:uncharacterized protein METZ01_LOCUS227485, partial [marine metagenome]